MFSILEASPPPHYHNHFTIHTSGVSSHYRKKNLPHRLPQDDRGEGWAGSPSALVSIGFPERSFTVRTRGGNEGFVETKQFISPHGQITFPLHAPASG